VSSLAASPPDASLRFFLNYELIDYITTWCISWVFVISLVASPHDVSLLYLPIRGDVSTPWQMQR
jgi:hypothetical protein